MSNIIFSLVLVPIVLLLIAGSVFLQIFLSKAKNRWAGLVIPFICFAFSLLTVLSIPAFTIVKTEIKTETMDGVIVSQETNESRSERPGILSMLATIAPLFFITNIPTLIFLAIYFSCQDKRKKNLELNKMNIQDLE